MNSSTPVRSVIIDDEPGNLVTLRELLAAYCPETKLIATALNGEEGYDIIVQHKPGLVFLDIEMPHGNAFQMLDKLSPIGFEVIFITAFDNYAVTAFKYAAVDYILKPVNISELKSAVSRAVKRVREQQYNEKIELFLNRMARVEPDVTKIGLTTAEGLVFRDTEEITHLAAEGSYTRVYLNGKKTELISKNLKELEENLPAALFCRIHHSYIVNMRYVRKYYRGRGGYVELADGTTLEVSVRRKEEFFSRFRHL